MSQYGARVLYWLTMALLLPSRGIRATLTPVLIIPFPKGNYMPNKAAAAKAWRQMKKHATRNRQVRTQIDIAVRLARRAIVVKSKEASSKVKSAVQLLDRAAHKGVLKANTAARLKSRLAQALHGTKT